MEQTIFCSQCGAKVNSCAKFCHSCGAKINTMEAENIPYGTSDNDSVSKRLYEQYKDIICGKIISA